MWLRGCWDIVQADLILSWSALLSFTDIACFYKLKVCGNPISIKSISIILPTAFSDLMSLCYILAILTIFQTFHYCFICYGDLWSVLLLLQKDSNSLNAQTIVAIFKQSSIFYLMYAHWFFFFWHNAIA